MVGQCVNHCFTLIFNGLTIHLILTLWISRWIPRQITFSRWIWSIRNIFTTCTLTYPSAQRVINYPASGRTNSSQHYTIRSVMSYIIVTYNNILVTAFVSQIRCVLQFSQSPWLHNYIELNTTFRTLAKNDFEKNLYKLMNNAVFGKIMENVRNHIDMRLLTRWEGRFSAKAMIAKPNFHSRSAFRRIWLR